MPVDLANPGRILHVGVILMNSITELLDVAPVDLFNCITKEFLADFPDEAITQEEKKKALDIQFHWVNEGGKPAKLSAGMTVLPTDTFSTCPPLDIVLMGAHMSNYTLTEAELSFIRKSYDDCSAFITICGGSQGPVQAGLFAGKTATGPLPFMEKLKVTVPDTKWVEKRWHRDGKLWTSATLLNGLDLMRAFGEYFFDGDREGSLMYKMLEMGAYPRRDVFFRDVLKQPSSEN